MESTFIEKYGHYISFTGAALVFMLAPMMSIGYYMAYGGGGDTPPFWFESVRPLLPDLADYGGANRVYAVLGRIFAFAYPLMIPGLVLIHRRHAGRGSKLETLGFAGLTLSLLVCFGGVSLDYWGVKAGWTTELLGLLMLLLTSTIYGIALMRAKVVSTIVAALFASAIPLCVLSFVLLRQIPSAPSIPIAVAVLAASAASVRNQVRLSPVTV